jgi:N6-adenosine-specific RNA methylase IME4
MKYGVILSDPPWRYGNSGTRGAAENHYPTMALGEICALPIRELAADDAVLLLWATWPLLSEGLQVVEAWGFQYVTGFPWIKIHGMPRTNLWGEIEIRPRYGVGFWMRGCSELLLIGRRGAVSPPDRDFMGLLSENYGHSRKPDNVYEYAEALPGPYLEMFARRPRSGWDAYGNEIAASVAL